MQPVNSALILPTHDRMGTMFPPLPICACVGARQRGFIYATLNATLILSVACICILIVFVVLLCLICQYLVLHDLKLNVLVYMINFAH